MPKRSSKKHRDVNVLDAAIMRQSTGEDTSQAPESLDKPQKNPHAVALGHLGGKKGGKARAEKLTPERRKEIAKLAASVRWRKRD